MTESAHDQPEQATAARHERPASVKVHWLVLFLQILMIGAVAEVVESFVVEWIGLPVGGGLAAAVGIVILGGIMAPVLYFLITKDGVNRSSAHTMLAAKAREQEFALRACREQLALKSYAEMVVASVPSALLVLSTDLIVRSVSESFKDLFNVGDHDAVGKPVEKILPLVGTWKLVAEVLGSDDPRHRVSVDVSDPVRKRDFHVTLTKLQRPDEEARLLLVVEDVTERKRLQEQVEASR